MVRGGDEGEGSMVTDVVFGADDYGYRDLTFFLKKC